MPENVTSKVQYRALQAACHGKAKAIKIAAEKACEMTRGVRPSRLPERTKGK